MKNIKVKTGFYIDDFSSANFDVVWGKLTTFINENQKNFSSIKVDKDNSQIIVSFHNESDIIDLMNTFDKYDLIKKKLNRQIRLNTIFDKEEKKLKVSIENTEKYDKFNEVLYSIDCSNLKNENSLYFHESSLIDYTKDYDTSSLMNCPYRLILISYLESELIYEKNFDKQIEKSNIKYMFLCINVLTDQILDDTFSSLNTESNININDFINAYNNDLYEDDHFNKIIDEGNIIKTYKFSNFKFAQSDFILPDGKELNFLNFKNFVSYFIYETFLNTLKSKLEVLW